MTSLALALVVLGGLAFAAFYLWLNRRQPPSVTAHTLEALAGTMNEAADSIKSLNGRIGAIELQLAIRRPPPKGQPNA